MLFLFALLGAFWEWCCEIKDRTLLTRYGENRYRRLNEVDRELAIKTFKENNDFYHPICRGMVEKDLFGT